MRILFVAPYVPSPSRFRSLRFIQGLANLGHHVTVVALTNNSESDKNALQEIGEICEAVHPVPLSRGGAFMQSALHVATATPLWAASHFSSHLTALLDRLVQENPYDIGHIEHLRMAYAAPHLKKYMPLIFDAVDCVTEQQQSRLDESDFSGLERMVSQQDFQKMRRYEPQSAAQFDKVLISSREGANSMEELAERVGRSLSVDVLPNGVDLDYFRPQAGVPILPGNIVFPGQMNNTADRDAVSYFLKEIFPGIRNAYPLATVTFVGGDPPPLLNEMASQAHSGIEVTGRVADARPYLARAAVAACPLRINGSRNRVLQLMAMGKALVTAPPACRALDMTTAGECLCLADTPLSFATQIIHLFNHPEEASRLGANARAYVEEHHDWSRIVRHLTQVYDDAIAARTCVAA